MVGVLALGLVFAGCGEIARITAPGTSQEGVAIFNRAPESDPDTFPLYAGQDWEVGQVLVYDDPISEEICVKFELFDEGVLEEDTDIYIDGWRITEVHLAIATDVDLIPQKNGNTIPGKFPVKDDEVEMDDHFAGPYCIPFEDIIGEDVIDCGTNLVIAAHAVIEKTECKVVVEAGSDFYVSNTDTKVVAGNVSVPTNAVFAHKPGDSGSPYSPVWDTNLNYTFDESADWIWESYYVTNPIAGDVVTFEREFEVSGMPNDGTLYIAADNGFAVELNNNLLGSYNLFQYPELGNLKQPYVNTTDWWNVQQYNLAPNLIQGTNTLKIIGVNEYMNNDDVDKGGSLQRVGDKYYNPGGVIFEFDVAWEEVEECITYDETVWGGTNDFAGKNWARYIEYELCSCENEPNLINGGFEEPEVDTSQDWDIYDSESVGLGWTVEWAGDYSGAPDPAHLEIHEGAVVTAYEGDQYAELDTDWDGPDGGLNNEPASVRIYQELETCPGDAYTLTYAWQCRNADSQIEVNFNDYHAVHPEVSCPDGWNVVSVNVVADEYIETLEFIETGIADSFGMFLDNVRVTIF